MVDMFDDKYRIQSSFFTFKEIGDKIQGTYIGKRKAKSKFRDELQDLYEIKCDTETENTQVGEIYAIWEKPIIRDVMRFVKFGQIVGMKLVELRKTTKGNPAQIIQVFADPKIVDEEWLAQNPNANRQKEDGGVEVEEVDFDFDGDVPFKSGQPTVGDVKTEEKLKEPVDKNAEALALAKKKYGIQDDNEVKNKVMNESGLAWIDANLDKIIELLK